MPNCPRRAFGFYAVIAGFPLRRIHHRVRRVRRIFNQKLLTPRPESILSELEGRLGGAISEPYFTEKPEEAFCQDDYFATRIVTVSVAESAPSEAWSRSV